MKILVGLFFFSFSLFSWAQGDLCKLVPDSTLKRVTLPRTPNYFFKMSPDGKYLYYIANKANWLYDLDTKTERRLPGFADPVPSADGEVLTYIDRGSQGWRIGAMKMNPRWSGPDNKSAMEIADAGGSYQSVGGIQASGTRSFFYLDEKADKIVIRNLRETNGKFTLSSPLFEMGGEGKYRLPMMSPDGRKFSVLNTQINKTQIFEIDPDQKPRLIDTLPVAGGKASFSYDGNSLTFHMTKTFGQITSETLYPAVLGEYNALRNVYAYDLRTKKIDQITDNVGKDSYFPIFLKNGSIAYIESTHDGKYHLTIGQRTPGASSRRFSDVENCYGPNVESELVRLGNLWASACNKLPSSITDSGIALTTALNIPVEVCLKLAKKAGDPSLRKLCDALDGKKVSPSQTTQVSPQSSPPVNGQKGEQIFRNQCAICHEGMEKKIISSPTLNQRLAGKGPNRMPPQGKLLSPNESKLLKEYLQKFNNTH